MSRRYQEQREGCDLDRSVTSIQKTRRFAEKREAILAAATRLFNQNGVKGVSLAAVAESVGLLTPSVTYYFRKKEDLAVACLLQSIATFNDLFLAASRESQPFSRLRECLRLYFEFRRAIALGRRAAPMQFDDIRALATPAREPVIAAYTQMFRHARALFDLRDADPSGRGARNARAHLLLSWLLWVPAWIHRYDEEDYGGIAERMSDIVLHGLGGRKASWSLLERRVELGVEGAGLRESFLRAAIRLINEQGYRGASVEKISALLNVTKGSFYHHNDNKNDLVLDCFERTFAVIRTAQNQAAAVGCSGWERLGIATSSLIQYQLSNEGPLLRSTALYALPEAIRHKTVGRMNRLSDRFAGLVIDGMRDGSIRPVDPVIAGELVNSMINGAAELSSWAPGLAAEAAAELYIEPLLTGLSPPSGQ
jgi:AcrR family transcriptional regulator